MNELRNYNAYLTGMRKSLEEKTFFLNQINVDDYDMIIDFGSGEGIVLEEVAKTLTNKTTILYGVDHDDKMEDITRRRLKGYGFEVHVFNNLEKIKVPTDKKALIIFSSVLHEVEDYWNTIENWIVENKTTIVVRDMYLENCNNGAISLPNIVKYAQMFPKNFFEFVYRYGKCGDDYCEYLTEKDIYHYLLKYTYLDSWQLELEEDYTSVPWGRLFLLGNVIYDNMYTLEFKRQQVLDDFGIELNKPTHRQMIIKVE